MVNGSLWTIPVELGFYVALPLLYGAVGDWKHRQGTVTKLIIAALVISALAWLWSDTRASFLKRLVLVSPLAHAWIFLLGALASRYRTRVMRLIRGQFLWWLIAYVPVGYWLPEHGWLALARYPLLAGVILSAAFTMPRLAQRLLRGQDLSYGVYIYHMVAINVLLWLGYRGSAWLVAVAMGLAVLAAAASWKFVEQPALRLKSTSLRVVDVNPAAVSVATDA